VIVPYYVGVNTENGEVYVIAEVGVVTVSDDGEIDFLADRSVLFPPDGSIERVFGENLEYNVPSRMITLTLAVGPFCCREWVLGISRREEAPCSYDCIAKRPQQPKIRAANPSEY